MNQNPIIVTDASYVGLYYAFSATGGYQIEQGFKTITMLPVDQINQFDVTDSVQIKFDVRTFNNYIGLQKDSQNQNITSTTFNENTMRFPIDTLTVNAADFLSNISVDKIISVGKLSRLYSDFIQYVNNYFGYPNGFTTIFNLSSQISANNGVFDANSFMNIITESSLNPSTGEYVNALTGSITVNYINQILNFVSFSNPFNNRNQGENNGLNFTIKDGFIDGDIVFIPNGITVTLNLDIIPNNINLNSLGTAHVTSLISSSNYTNGYFSSTTTNSISNIKQVVTAPLLLKLTNIS
jgi:hypothetical protein